MTKITPVTDVIDELFESILATSKKRRALRSETFWNKFGFKRRTVERIEAVKTAMKNRAIQINLDDKSFGSEKKEERLIFKLIESDLPKTKNISKIKTSEIPPVKHKEPGEPAFESVHNFDGIEAKLKHLASVEQLNFTISFIFSVLFAQVFWNDTPSYELSPGVFGATRSNWTYHTAGAISQTCKILKLICKFEALGKRDAIIETMEDPPEMVLAAEWEWDYDDIFGTGKELEKLKITCQKNPAADAFLLIYCPAAKYLSHLEKIAEYWISQTAADMQGANLFLHTVIFEEKGSSRAFQKLSTVMIHPRGIDVWSGTCM